MVATERKRLARDLLVDIRRLDRDLADAKQRITDAILASGTTLTELHGVGPITAALILGHVGDPARFRTRDQFASYNGTALIEASSGPRVRHRLNPRGNRTLNHAIHMIAVTQIRNDTPGRADYLRRQAEGKTRKEAIRALKRRISDAVWRQLQVGPAAPLTAGPGGHPGTSTEVQRDRLGHPERPALRTSHFPDPTPRYAHAASAR